MGKKKYTLTISILASNRKDTLPKTLNSIKPLLDNVSSELIVVDTGCDDELLSVIRGYTDKIIKFQWCKDFSKARNTGLEQAQGEWFMFIDDDEWFEDVTELVHFFSGAEKDKYGFGKYVVRNYHNMEGTEWSDSIAGRVFKLFEGTKFVDALHERPVNIAGPTKNFSAYAHHYGYAYKTEEDKRAHFERNISIIEAQVKNEPHLARHFAHLAQEYCTVKDYDKVIEVSEDGIKNVDMSYTENAKDLPALYGTIIWALVNQHKNEEAYQRGIELIERENCSELGRYALYEFIAVAAYLSGRYNEALECVQKYFEYKELFDSNPELKYQQSAILIMDADTEENVFKTATIGFAAASFMGDEEKIETYISYMDFSKDFGIPEPQSVMKNIVLVMRNTARISACVAIAERIMLNKNFGNMLLLGIMQLKEEDVQGFYKLADIMAMTNSNNGYVHYLRIISARDDIYTERITEYYKKTIKSVGDIINLDDDFFNIAIDKSIAIGEMINETSVDRWMKSVDSWLLNVKVRELIGRCQQLNRVLGDDSIHKRYFDMGMVEALLIRKRLDSITMDNLKEELTNYVDVVLCFYKDVYKEVIFVEHPSVLPVRCQIAILLGKLCKGEADICSVKTQILNGMPSLKHILDKYEELSKALED